MSKQSFSASGKLLLFGEYLVLRGAQSLVMPLRFQQTVSITPRATENILWNCFEKENRWLFIEFSPTLQIANTWDEAKALIVQNLLHLIQKEKPALKITGKEFRFDIDFDRGFGFGTSATFLSLLSQWSGVDPYRLLEKSFGGSGFDIAAATATSVFLYQVERGGAKVMRKIRPVMLSKAITEKLLFVYSGKKQQSDREVTAFSDRQISPGTIREMNEIVNHVVQCNNIWDFEALMNGSETLLSGILSLPALKEKHFNDYPYSIKSLGAWGGDFFMATCRDEVTARNYFLKKGMSPIFSYDQLIRP